MKILTTYNQLPWKTVLGINTLVLVLGGAVIAQQLINQPTQTTSKAVVIDPTPTPVANYPSAPPEIIDLEMFYGQPGDAVRIRGNHFGEHQWQSQVFLNGLPLDDSTVQNWSDSAIDFTIPQGTQTGAVAVVVNGHEAVSRYPLVISTTSADPTLYIDTSCTVEQDLCDPILYIKDHAPNTIASITLKDGIDTSPIFSSGQKLSELTLSWQLASFSPTPLLKLNSLNHIRGAKLQDENGNYLPLRTQIF